MSKIKSVFLNRRGRLGLLIALCFIVPLLSVAITPSTAVSPTANWTKDRLVDDDMIDDEIRPSIATDNNGYLYVAYEDYEPLEAVWGISVARSTDGGNTWSFFYGFYYSGYHCGYPSIAIDPADNRIYLAYEFEWTSTDHDIYCDVYTPGLGWSETIVDDDLEDDRYPFITSEYQYGSDNHQYITYEFIETYDNRDLMLANTSNHGSTWSIQQIRGGGMDTNVYSQASVTNAGGHIYIAYRYSVDYESTSEIKVDVSSDRGVSWPIHAQIDGLSNNCSWPSVAATHGGNTVAVAFEYEYSPTDHDIYYSYSNDSGTTWYTGYPLATWTRDERMPTLTADGGGSTSDFIYGHIHAAYWDDYDIKYSKAYYDSLDSGWSQLQTVNEANWASGFYSKPTITTQYRNSEYQPCVAWTDLRDISYDIYYSTTDTVAPKIDQPADITYVEGTTGHSITWNPSDDNPDHYNITKNGDVVDSGPWDGGSITIGIDGLLTGTYTYTCTVNDTEGHWASYGVTVTVVRDDNNPTIDSPSDITYEVNTTGHSITWTPSDEYPLSYNVTRDGVLVFNRPWNGGSITINVDGLSPSTYEYTCTVYDVAGNSASDSVTVIVTESSSQDGGGSDDNNPLDSLFGDSDVGMYAAIGVSVGFAAYLARSLSRSLRRRQAGPWDEGMDDDFFKV